MNLKENLKAKLIELVKEPELHPVGDTGFFVKMRTIGDIQEVQRLQREMGDLTTAQNLALELRDANGELVFDIKNEEDMALLAGLPHSFFFEVMQEVNEVSNKDFFQNSRHETS